MKSPREETIAKKWSSHLFVGLPLLPQGALFDTLCQCLDENIECAVAFIDLDGFGTLNLNYSYSTADWIAHEYSALLCQKLDVFRSFNRLRLFRYGGDEFALVLIGDDDLEDCLRKQLQQIAKSRRMSSPTYWSHKPQHMPTLSAGIKDCTEMKGRRSVARAENMIAEAQKVLSFVKAVKQVLKLYFKIPQMGIDGALTYTQYAGDDQKLEKNYHLKRERRMTTMDTPVGRLQRAHAGKQYDWNFDALDGAGVNSLFEMIRLDPRLKLTPRKE